ncbi:phosphoribosylglycinamide formyltransferase [Sphingomonas sp. XMGL2]|uniref:Phosphoribosylglycinamide formyltransferase n=1 Tax=Sphingomonas quercus TaxID=2842451 RepID=A0ABS6BL78_9SPHN|nr:phosphoribosylglycinamide formyltransferase [Sphingomonas quercus]
MAEAGAEKAKVAVLISGRGSNMVALADAAKAPDCPYEIVLVGSNDPAAPGLAAAARRGIPTWSLSHKGLKRAEFDMAVDAALRAAGAQWVALAGYMRLLSPDFVARWEGRMLNIHPSLLPRYKGLDTHARVLAAGDPVHGVSVHLVTAELDGGPVLARREIQVLPGDTPETLASRALVEEHILYPQVLAEMVRR